MRRTVRMAAAVLAGASVMMGLTACGGSKEADNTLTVAMECAYAPYNWTQGDDSNGAVQIKDSQDYAYGYDVMMAKLIAEKLGMDLEIVNSDWDSLCLARVNGQDTASYGLRHVGAGVDGDDEEGCRQHTQVDAEYIGQSVVDEGCLDHHGGAAEDLHVGVQDELDDHEDVVLCRVLRLIRGDRLDDTHRKADHTSDKGGNQRDQHGVADALHKGLAVGFQDKQDLRDKSLR